MKKQEQQPEDAERYSTYERNRRNRFNAILETLAQVLPGYNDAKESVKTVKDDGLPLVNSTAGSTGCKWSKREVVERALAHIRRLQAGRGLGHVAPGQDTAISAPPSDAVLANTIRRLRIQNRLLRRLIVSELKLTVDEKRVDALTVKQIKEVIRARPNQGCTDDVVELSSIAPSEDVFVAPVTACSDHTYSLIVQDHVDVEVCTESQVEPISACDEDQVPDESSSNVPVPTSHQPPILQACTPKESVVVSLPQLTVIPATSLSLGSSFGNFAVVSTAALGPQYILSSFPTGSLFLGSAANKLPLPRLPPVHSSKAAKKPAQSADCAKKKREAASEKESAKAKESLDRKGNPAASANDGSKCKDSPRPVAPEAASGSPAEEVSTFSFSDVTNINSTLPDTLLATEDDATPEIVDLTRDKANSSDSGGEKVTKISSEKKQATVKDRKRAKDCESAEGAGSGKSKRSKSYSIAALCQISLDLVEPGMVSSPGLVSLASLGTSSPLGTPAPTPTPPRLESAPPLDAQVQVPAGPTSSHIQELSSLIQSSSVDSIKESRTAVAATSDKKGAAERNQLPKKANPATVSPSKSFLTSFPVVSASSGESSSANGDSQQRVRASSAIRSRQEGAKDFSVFNFSEPCESPPSKQFSNKASVDADKSEKQLAPPSLPPKRTDPPPHPPPPIRVTAPSTLAPSRAEPPAAVVTSGTSGTSALAYTSKGTWLSSASSAVASTSSSSMSVPFVASTHSQLHLLPSLHHYPPLTQHSGSAVANVSYSRGHPACTSSTSTLQHISAAVAATTAYHHPYPPPQHQYQPSYSPYYPASSSGVNSGSHYPPSTSSVLGSSVDYQSSMSRQAGGDCYGPKGYLTLSPANTMPYQYGMMSSGAMSASAISAPSSKSDRKPRSGPALDSQRSRSSSLDPKVLSPPAVATQQLSQQSQHAAVMSQALHSSQAQQAQQCQLHNDPAKHFSVTNLVSADMQQARRSNKRLTAAASSSSSSSSIASSYPKSQRQPSSVRSDAKEELLGSKRSSKSSSATSRLPRSSLGRIGSYSTESLLSGSGMCLDPSAANMTSVHSDAGKIHTYDLESKSGGGWMDFGQSVMCAPFPPFPSTSPASLCNQDAFIDFSTLPSAILSNVLDGPASSSAPPTSTSKQYPTQQQSTNALESLQPQQQSHSGKSQSRSSLQQSMAPLDSHVQALERSLNAVDQQQYGLSSAFFDGGYNPLSTLTPPASSHHSDESMGCFGAANSLYPPPISSHQQSGRSGGAYGGGYPSMHVGAGKTTHGEQQLTTTPLHSGGALITTSTSNLSNFNLSTILPEMHSSSEKLLAPSAWAGDAAMAISSLATPISSGNLDLRQQPLPSHNALLFMQGHGHQLQQLRHYSDKH